MPAPREGRAEGAGPGAPRPPSPGGLQGPPRAQGGLCLTQLLFGKAPARVQDGGERVGSQALATRSGPAPPAMQQGEGREAPATLRAPSPRSGHRITPPPVTPRPSVPAASVWRLQPPPHSAEPRPRQLQKMAAKAAPVATLPRAGGGRRSPPAAPLPSPPRDSPPGRRDPSGHRGIWGRSGGREGRGRGGYLAAEGAGVGGGRGTVQGGRYRSVPHPACPVPSRGRGARVGQC